MELGLEPVTALPEVVCVCIYEEGGKITKHHDRHSHDPDLLRQNAALMTDQYRRNLTLFPFIEGISSHFDTHCYYVRKIGKGRFLFIVHDTDLDYQLLNLKTKIFVELGADTDPVRLKSTITMEPDPDIEQSEIRALMVSGELSNLLAGISWALSKTVGPIGPLLFEEAMSKWLKSGTPCMRTLPHLLHIVGKIIRDSEKEKEFQEKAAPFIVSG